MKVLMISHMFPSQVFPVERSGVFVVNLIKALQRMNVSVQVISPVPSPGPFKYIRKNLGWYAFSEQIPMYDKYQDIPVQYPRYISPVVLWRHMYTQTGKLMASGIKKHFLRTVREFNPDIIHSHTLIPDTHAATIIGKRYFKDIPIVCTIHGGEITYPMGIRTLEERPEHFAYPLSKRLIGHVLSKSDGIITVSRALEQLISHYWTAPYKTIYNGIGDEWFDGGSKHDREKEIVTVGALIERKRIAFLADAFSTISAKYPDWKLRIIGEGPERTYIEKAHTSLIKNNRILLMGNIPNEEVRTYMQRSSIFSLPSVREPFGVVYIEAMASHLPVIGCSDGGPSEIIDEGINGFLIEPDNMDMLIEHMEFLINNKEKRIAMGNEAYEKARNSFDWHTIASETINYYKAIISSS